MSSLFTHRPRKKPHIEIIPMIDVMLLLLVFYILSTLAMTQARGIHVQLPQAVSSDSDTKKNKEIVVSIDKSGRTFLNKTPVHPDGLGDAIKALAATMPGGLAEIQANPVIINADMDARHRYVVRAMDELRKLDILRFSVATEADHS